jgi:hypothetical protein
MANWQYPTGAYKAYVPKGRGWGKAGQAIGGGLQNFSAQMIAIKQFEAEQEAKRQKAEQERLQAQLKAAMDAEKMAWEKQKWGEQKELDERKIAASETYQGLRGDLMEAQIAQIYHKMSEKDLEPPKGLEKILGIGLKVKSKTGNQIIGAINQAQAMGFMTGDWTVFDELEPKLQDPALFTSEGSRVDMFGFPVTTTQMTSDMAQATSMYYQLAALSQGYREKPREFKQIAPLKPSPVQPRNDERYKQARTRAYRILLQYKKSVDEGKPNEKLLDEADKIMSPFKPSEEEMNDLLKKAGLLK